MATKNYYYVIVATNKGAKFVTKTENSSKTAFWNEKEKPQNFSKYYAQDLAYCLSLNFYPAYVLQSYHKIENQIFIKGDEKYV